MPPLEPNDLIFRTDDPTRWNDGKGSNLTAVEVDLNFWVLLAAIIEIQESPVQPLQIDQVNVSGNQMTFVLSDGTTTFGPFTLPTAAFNWTGDWQANHNYGIADLFTANEGMYFVTKAYTSSDTFNPNAGDMQGPFAVLVFPYPNIYDLGFFYPGTPGAGLTVGDPMFAFLAPRQFYILADAPRTVATLTVAADATITLPIEVGGVEIGTIVFSAGDTEGVVTFPADVQFEVGDILMVLAPAMDAEAKNLNVTICGIKGVITTDSESESESST